MDASLLYLLSGFVVTLPILTGLLKPAKLYGLLDRPSSRKKHTSPVPLIGGLAVALATIVLSLVHLILPTSFAPNLSSALPILACSYILVLFGVLDDYFELNAILRMAIQFATTLLTISITGIFVSNMGGLGWGQSIESAVVGSIFTGLCVIGVINAANMIDGVDGLLGSILLLTFSAIAALSFRADNEAIATLSMFMNGALLAVMACNIGWLGERRKVFLGDAGSTFFGFLVAWWLIVLSQQQGSDLTSQSVAISTVSAGWIFGFPIVDTVSVMTKRMVTGESPFSPGRDHFHHRLIDAGYSTKHTVLTIASMHGLMVITGFISNFLQVNDNLMLIAFVGITVAFYFLADRFFASLYLSLSSQHQGRKRVQQEKL